MLYVDLSAAVKEKRSTRALRDYNRVVGAIRDLVHTLSKDDESELVSTAVDLESLRILVETAGGQAEASSGNTGSKASSSGLPAETVPEYRASSDTVGQLDRCSPAQVRVLSLVAHGYTSKQIASQLGISHRTVQNHRAGVAKILHLQGPHALIEFALLNRLQIEERKSELDA